MTLTRPAAKPSAVARWMSALRANRATALALAAILGLALALRLYGINWGFPYILHPDEHAIVHRAYRFGSGDLNPHWFGYPSLQMYLLFGVNLAYTLFGFVTGAFTSLADVRLAWIDQHFTFHLLGRLTTVALALGTIVALYVLSRRLFGRRVALLASLILAIMPLHVEHAHYATPDPVLAFWIMLGMLAVHNVFKQGRRRDYVLAGMCVGLATSTKYTGALLAVAVVLAHGLRVQADRPGLWKRIVSADLLFAGLASLVAFALTSPYFFLDFRNAIDELGAEFRVAEIGLISQSVDPPSWLWYFVDSMPDMLTPPLVVLSLIGLIAALFLPTQRRFSGVLVAFTVAYFVFIARSEAHWDRWLVPLAPFFALFAARLLLTGLERLKGWPSWAMGAVIAAAMLWPLVTSLNIDYGFTVPDTRQRSSAWLAANAPLGSRILQDRLGEAFGYCQPFPTEVYDLERIPVPVPTERGYAVPADLNLDKLRVAGFDYVVVNDWKVATYYSAASMQAFPDVTHAYQRFYESLDQSLPLVSSVIPQSGETGPTIRIYSLNSGSPRDNAP